MKKKAIIFSALLLQAALMSGQSQTSQTYDNFEGMKVIHYGEKTGTLDTVSQNPAPNSVNRKAKCAKYVRNSEKKFDVLKMTFINNLSDSSVSLYSTYLGIPPKLKMKVYTSAPVGTLVEILLGNKVGNNAYPGGTNSQYQAYTTVTNSWEELEFKFSQIPKGSETSASQIDQITVLFAPNSANSDTYYFDDITGPVLSKKKPELMSTTTNKNEDKKAVKNDDKKNTTADTKKPKK